MLRLGSDYVRFVQPEYLNAPILRDRARDRVPALIRTLADYEGPGHGVLRALLKKGLRAAERAVPPAPDLEDAVLAYEPDVTLVTPSRPGQYASVVSVRPPDAAAASARLSEAGVVHSFREGGIRLSPFFYNTVEENETIIRALVEIEGRR